MGVTRTSAGSKNVVEMRMRKVNRYNSATGHPIHFMFGFRVGFSGSADRMDLLPLEPNPSSGCALSWKISNEHNL